MKNVEEYRGIEIRVKQDLTKGKGRINYIAEAEHTRGRNSEEILRMKQLWEKESPGQTLKGTPSEWAHTTYKFQEIAGEPDEAKRRLKKSIDEYVKRHPVFFKNDTSDQ